MKQTLPVSFWLYTSMVADVFDAGIEADRIVSLSYARNQSLSITGALVFTGIHFAQYIEGPTKSVDILKTSITNDRRHREIRTIRTGTTNSVHFGEWRLAYAGFAKPYESLVAMAHRSGGNSGYILLMEMMCRFTADHPQPAKRA
jgi:hypothetical protein